MIQYIYILKNFHTLLKVKPLQIHSIINPFSALFDNKLFFNAFLY